jgi:hypothetical protein
MKQSTSSEATSYAAIQEFPIILWNPKVHYSIHKSTPLVPVLIHTNSVHPIPSLQHPSTYVLVFLVVSSNNLYAALLSHIRAICSVHHSLLHFFILFVPGEE